MNRSTIYQAGLVALLAFLLYTLTLAPTVLWGDDAELQRLAILNQPGSGARSYWLWTSIAHPFTKLPFGDLAWRVNVSSAVFAAGTVAAVFVMLRLLDVSLLAAWVGSAALAVSHTFWLHAVRAEVYALFLFVLATAVALLLAWRKQTTRLPMLALGMFLLGLAFSAHLLAITFLPAVAVLIISAPKQKAARIYAVAIAALLVGLTPYALNVQAAAAQLPISRMVSNVLTIRARDVLLWLGFLGYQFMLLLPVAAWGTWRLWQTKRSLFFFLGLAFLGNVIFALSFHVPDQYVFYLPSYLIVACGIGVGVHALQARFSQRPTPFRIAIAAAVMLTILLYRLTPPILDQSNLTLLSVRTLPYRDNNRFFFYPPKNGYEGASRFGEEVLATLPPDAALLADWLPYQTLTYFQEVQGVRPDVLVMDTAVISDQPAWLRQQTRTRPVFIADNERYYDLAGIAEAFEIVPYGPVFQLAPKP